MKIAIINGNMRHGSTWHCMDAFMREMGKHGEVEATEFFLPRDMPHFCTGCYSCFYHGEGTCPHAEFIKPIVEAMAAADLIILTSPVYSLDVTGQMKALLDHLCFMWVSHRPNPALFHKVALVVTTTAGMGLRHTAKTMKNSLTYWGAKKVFVFQKPVAAMSWSDISEKKRAEIHQNIARRAARIVRAVKNVEKLPNPPLRGILFRLMAGMQRKNDWNPTDRNHWQANGWLDGGRPF